MRVLLLGATGNLGRRCIPALLAHNHTLVILVRDIPKLHSLISPSLASLVTAIVQGDATDVAALKKVLRDYQIDAVVNVAGNQVLPWKEHQLSKIAKAAADAAVEVGRERGKPLRMWVMSAIAILRVPGTDYLLFDYFPRLGRVQHEATMNVMEAIPVEQLKWSLFGVAWLWPAEKKQGLYEPLNAPRTHDLMVKSKIPPDWEESWLRYVPFIGGFLNLLYAIAARYGAKYEDVADFLAEDLENGSQEWVGERVGVKQRNRKDL